jgi:hypothetical protein
MINKKKLLKLADLMEELSISFNVEHLSDDETYLKPTQVTVSIGTWANQHIHRDHFEMEACADFGPEQIRALSEQESI